ncbi:hypothetical protein LZ554_004814 [Drepanopeziza brunnea f. sp. 'monogermtubi']|nr:hypothetical protein LZ554_004814 [Drepanopeziza brunnea f. sp. 'monogermtubi']
MGCRYRGSLKLRLLWLHQPVHDDKDGENLNNNICGDDNHGDQIDGEGEDKGQGDEKHGENKHGDRKQGGDEGEGEVEDEAEDKKHNVQKHDDKTEQKQHLPWRDNLIKTKATASAVVYTNPGPAQPPISNLHSPQKEDKELIELQLKVDSICQTRKKPHTHTRQLLPYHMVPQPLTVFLATRL